MIAHLRGRLLEKQPTRLVVEAGGVGFEVLVPLATSRDAGEVGSEVALHTVQIVREDALTLFGFGDARERALFQKLIGVSGVGPKLALNALSGAGASELVVAIRDQDVAFLTRIPGIGKKTAERLSLELKDGLAAFEAEAPLSAKDRRAGDAIEALVSLGFKRAPAREAVRKALERLGKEAEVEALVRSALGTLSAAGPDR